MTAIAAWTGRPAPRSWADGALNAAAGAWFATMVIGQSAFLYYILAFYGASVATGHFEAWARNTMLIKGYVAGDGIGNLFFAAHVMLAALVTFAGVLQLVRGDRLHLHRHLALRLTAARCGDGDDGGIVRAIGVLEIGRAHV